RTQCLRHGHCGRAGGLADLRRRAGRRSQHRPRLRLVDRRPGNATRTLGHPAGGARRALRRAPRRRVRERARRGGLRARYHALASTRLSRAQAHSSHAVEPCNRLYRPSAAELDYYARVLAAFDQALARGSASTTVDGRMIDAAMANAARRVLEADAAWRKAGRLWTKGNAWPRAAARAPCH